ncbi:predicted protein [Lichtheimia corymbifera JMRC:FSU:9682]|uniref:Uncharacterized protein n=1 Tax=Lichtheimia corymbifera JMRC:FSU:9682 TaxID=1263082 RepID=A0A068RVM6_9FUNG|nr:predicted protein [Lichtheimia corymbifera JMRC:FSU:9682]
MKRGVFNRTKLRGGVKRTLCRSFTIVVAILRFTQCRHQPKSKKIQEVDPSSVWLVMTLRESEIDELDRETCTQGALDHDEQLCSMNDSAFHCKA